MRSKLQKPCARPRAHNARVCARVRTCACVTRAGMRAGMRVRARRVRES